jgi:glycogen synthase
MSPEKTQIKGLDTVAVFTFTSQGQCEIHNDISVMDGLGRDKALFLHRCLELTWQTIQKYNSRDYLHLTDRKVRLRVSPAAQRPVMLMSHEVLLHEALLEFDPKTRMEREAFVIGNLATVFYHVCHADLHISQVNRYGLHFFAAHPAITEAIIRQTDTLPENIRPSHQQQVLRQLDTLLLLEEFWTQVGKTQSAKKLLEVCGSHSERQKNFFRSVLTHEAALFAAQKKVSFDDLKKQLIGFSGLYFQGGTAIVVYQPDREVVQVIRIAPAGFFDGLSHDAACRTISAQGVRTEIFHDNGPFVYAWIDRLKIWAADPALNELAQMLISDHIHTVNAATEELFKRIRNKQNAYESMRLLYAALYYWHNSNKGISRSTCLRVSKILEDLLTERPAFFPSARVNRSYFRGESPTVCVRFHKPARIASKNILARLQWSVNGRKKQALPMPLDKSSSSKETLQFETRLSGQNGWIHYSVQISTDAGKTWQFEKFDENSHGLLKRVADERGQRMLSLYADAFNLKLDESMRPVRDKTGAFVYGTFDELAEQLPAIKQEGYTRIYPLGALELGWAGEAGPDPSVFSIWDGRTVRRDLGGIEGLLRLKEKADELGMKILLCVLSHFSRAYHSWPYSLPVYITGPDGKLSRRAGWDGEWDEWLDSFMVNMRDLDNVEYLAEICRQLTEYGFGLRIDVGHGFDTVFPARHDLPNTPKLFGEVTVKGFEPIDLRGTNEPNIPILYMNYRVQKAVPGALVAYSEQWHGNEVRMIKSATVPYNAIIKNLENIRSGQAVDSPLGFNNNLEYLQRVLNRYGGQTLSMFNSHDEEAPASNYQNMIWPAAALLVFSGYGPLMYHISRLPGPEVGSFSKRFDMAYTECWKHWVNNRFSHPWQEEETARQDILRHYPYLRGFGAYLRGLYAFADDNPAITKGSMTSIATGNGRIAAFIRSCPKQKVLCVFNFPNSYLEGQQSLARTFNFRLRNSETGQPAEGLNLEDFYEMRERYNNVEGKMRYGQKEFWSGHELLELGFGGVLEPVSCRVYEILSKESAVSEKQVLFDSFRRFFRYGHEERIRHCYVARVFLECCSPQLPSYDRFCELFGLLINWVVQQADYGVASLGLLLRNIGDHNPDTRQVIAEFLMRIAVNEQNRFDRQLCRAAVDILQSIRLGTIVLVSPESRFSGESGGVGIYTTDIADTLSELGFHVVLVTPLYERNRNAIISRFAPKFEGHQFTVQFPNFNEQTQTAVPGTTTDVVNILRANLIRRQHGKRSRVEVLYLENSVYLDAPYSGSTGEDKVRRARVLAQGALEALRAYNYYPSIIQTNEWPAWLVSAFLTTWKEFHDDPHFANTKVGSMMHNPHPSYGIVLTEANPAKRNYYCDVLGLDPRFYYDLAINRYSPRGHEIDLMHTMLRTTHFIGTVSKAMKERMLRETWLFTHAWEFAEKEQAGMFFARRNGFNMAARQRFWFGTKKSLVETWQPSARKRLFYKYYAAKKTAKINLQNDPRIRLTPDSENTDHIIFGMLHRICKQKGFELLVDWKVYTDGTNRYVRHEPWKMDGSTMLEYFLSLDSRIQFVICGRVEDTMEARRYDMHLRRIADRPDMAGRFAYFPQGSLPPDLYRNLYVGCQYFVMPSGGEVGEPCGISQQEAHAGGTPVIAHHQDGLQHTVADNDFGDLEYPANGIKFTGFSGETLLDAMLDAVEVYTHGRRRLYKDQNGKPRRLDYDDLVFNAFTRDHRWIKPLRDYIDMYAKALGVCLPEHLDALRLIEEVRYAEGSELGDVMLKFGLSNEQAITALIAAAGSDIASVRSSAAKTLVHLAGVLKNSFLAETLTQLRRSINSPSKHQAESADWCIQNLKP